MLLILPIHFNALEHAEYHLFSFNANLSTASRSLVEIKMRNFTSRIFTDPGSIILAIHDFLNFSPTFFFLEFGAF